MKTEIEFLIDKANRSLSAAKKLCAGRDYDFAVSRAYYTLFYISEALLLEKGKSFSKHAAVISAVYNEYVKNGELPKEFHKTLYKAFNLRQESDYLSSTQITREVATSLIGEVEIQLQLAISKVK